VELESGGLMVGFYTVDVEVPKNTPETW